jgi:hypothetical protein
MAQHSKRWYQEEIKRVSRLIDGTENRKAKADLTKYRASLYKALQDKYGVKVVNGKVQGGKNESI